MSKSPDRSSASPDGCDDSTKTISIDRALHSTLASPWDNRRQRLSLPRQVKAEVKFVVVPVRVMVAAPLAGFVHSGDVMVYLVTAVAVTQYIAVDSGPV